MIPVNELRIGNWVILEMYGEPAQINSIKQRKGGYAVHFDSSLSTMEKDIFPITLTPDVLEAAGFKADHRDDSYTYWDNGHPLFAFLERDGRYGYTGDDFNIYGCGVEYLHQLQNLYFALTGEELTLSPI